MVEAIEFRDVFDLNKYLNDHPKMPQFDIIPVARVFTNPKSGLMTNTITYVLILGY
jgi:hypothetical protein